MEAERSEPSPAEETRERSARPILIAVLVAAILGVAGFAWVRAHPQLQRLCTLAGAVDTPEANSPEGAFNAWWDLRGPEDVRGVTSHGIVPEDGQQPTKSDFTRLSDTSWEWRYADRSSVGVNVGRPIPANAASGTWAVTGVNQCTYGPINGGT